MEGEVSQTGRGALVDYNASWDFVDTAFFSDKGAGRAVSHYFDTLTGTGADADNGDPVQEIEVFLGDTWKAQVEYDFGVRALGQSSARLDFKNTIQMYIIPLTEGASFSAESGSSYEKDVVPEPGTGAIVLASLVFLLAKDMRKRRTMPPLC